MAIESDKTIDRGGIMRAQINGPAALVMPRTRHNLLGDYAMPTIASRRFYVYILCRPSGAPFYVGKGSGDRLYAHDLEARKGHKCPKCSIIRKIWRQGGTLQRYILLETDDEHEALAYERELIALYGRQTLANLTDGGEGPSGASPSAKTRRTLQRTTKAYFTAHPEAKAKFLAAAAAYLRSPEGKAERSALMKERYENNPDEREATGRQSKAAWDADPERRERLRARMRARYEDPAEREKQRDTSHLRTPESLAKLSAVRKAQMTTPEARAEQSRLNNERYADPTERTKQSERMKAWWAERKAKEAGKQDD